jgi:hypothetical protein
MISFWDVIGRSETGPLIEETQFNWRIYELANQMVEKHGIRYDPEQIVPADDGLPVAFRPRRGRGAPSTLSGRSGPFPGARRLLSRHRPTDEVHPR